LFFACFEAHRHIHLFPRKAAIKPLEISHEELEALREKEALIPYQSGKPEMTRESKRKLSKLERIF